MLAPVPLTFSQSYSHTGLKAANLQTELNLTLILARYPQPLKRVSVCLRTFSQKKTILYCGLKHIGRHEKKTH